MRSLIGAACLFALPEPPMQAMPARRISSASV